MERRWGWLDLLRTMERAARVGEIIGIGKKGIGRVWYRIEGVWEMLEAI